jgi:signal transduction histidine kinase
MARFVADEQGGSLRGDARPERELYRFLDRALFWLEAATLAVLLLITLAQPRTSLVGLPTWGIVLLFIGYSLLADLIQNRAHSLRALRWKYIADLPVTALAYLLAGERGGPLFVLFILAADCAAARMSPRGTLIYAATAAAAMTFIDLALLPSSPPTAGLSALSIRLIVFALVGLGMALVMHRLMLEREVARSAHDEAERLAVLDRLRADFIASVSHDLRTPLTASKAGLGMLEIGVADRLPPDERELLRDVCRNIERLGLLIDDLLAVNQLESGTLQVDHVPLDLRAPVGSAIAMVQPLIREKGQVLEVDLPEMLPVSGDPRRLEQVIVNLVANAHRHTPTGTSIAISGRIRSGGVVLSVRDNGPGIPDRELEAIFKRHHRITGAGSGLGLTIAKGIVELHGGRIWAESESGQGATIHVALPRQRNGDDR